MLDPVDISRAVAPAMIHRVPRPRRPAQGVIAALTQYRERNAWVVLHHRAGERRAVPGAFQRGDPKASRPWRRAASSPRSPSTRSASRHHPGELCALARAFEQGGLEGLDGPAQAGAIPNSSLPVKRLHLQVHVIPPLRLIGSRLAGHRRCEVIGCFLIGRNTRRQ